ncbi:MAG TPA: Calx-beta domain-containing protein [Acidimicrobiia bacterium]|nr:Calx-beta domain-containing protein [Acidimicrobiia bacterium]
MRLPLSAHVNTRFSGRRRRRALTVVALAAALIPGARLDAPAGAATSVLSIDDVRVSEGDSGTRTATFTVTLSPAASERVTVDAFTANGAAVGGQDYRLVSQTITFAPGQTEASVVVPVLGDELGESDEDFTVQLTEASEDVVIADESGEAIIVDDDLAPRLSVSDVEIHEGEDAVFVVSLFPATDEKVTVEFATAGDTASSPDDFLDTARLVEFKPGETERTVKVPVADDFISEEPEETFNVTLSNPTGDAIIVDEEGLATIFDDDVLSQLTVNEIEIFEGNEGYHDAVFTVEMYPPSDELVTVEFFTENDDAFAPEDYVATAGVLRFLPGETLKPVPVPIRGDLVDERQPPRRRRGAGEDDRAVRESFQLRLGDATNAEVADNDGIGWIIDDDALPALVVDDATVAEGNGTSELRFRVSLFPVAGELVTVNFSTRDGTAVAPADYEPAAGRLFFEPGESEKIVAVPIKADALSEGDETMQLVLTDAVNTELEDDNAEAIIVDDDVDPALSIEDLTVPEGDDGEARVPVTVRLSEPSEEVVTFKLSATGGNATSPDDYGATGGTLSIAPGETELTVEVPVVGDTEEEDDEDIEIEISDAVNATIAKQEGVVTIVEDDAPSAQRVAMAANPRGRGYWVATADGRVYALGGAPYHGRLKSPPNRPIVSMAVTPSGGGYWLTAVDGGVFAFGDAGFFGSTGKMRLNQPIVAMAATPSARGYWLTAADGGVFSFGDARFFGSTGHVPLNRPIVGMSVAKSGRGYWLVASDGGVFAFGNADFFGSTGDVSLNRPIVAMAATPSAQGYWLTASDGGVFAFGDADFFGSTGDVSLTRPIVAMTTAPAARGYWLTASDGGIFAFGDAPFFGSVAGRNVR